LSSTVSVRISRELKEKLDELNINVSDAVRKYLLSIIAREENIRKLDEVDKGLRSRTLKIPEGTAEDLIREERDLEH
jgi:predicted transcriptional regulator